MSDNYAVINGKRLELTEEQLSMLGVETRNNPFKRGGQHVRYFYIDSDDNIYKDFDSYLAIDNRRFERVNYFSDEELARQVALHQLLYRKLLKFAYDNGYEDTTEWDGINMHWSIEYNTCRNAFSLNWYNTYKSQEVYFSSEEGAEHAIKEVVEPFMKEHMEFVW